MGELVGLSIGNISGGLVVKVGLKEGELVGWVGALEGFREGAFVGGSVESVGEGVGAHVPI